MDKPGDWKIVWRDPLWGVAMTEMIYVPNIRAYIAEVCDADGHECLQLAFTGEFEVEVTSHMAGDPLDEVS